MSFASGRRRREPAKTPRAVINRLNRAINAAPASPEVKRRLLRLGVESLGRATEAFRKHITAEIAKWQVATEKAKIPKSRKDEIDPSSGSPSG